MMTRPPGPARTVRLLAGLLLRRFYNRLRTRRRRRKDSVEQTTRRTGTGRKSAVGSAGVIFIALVFMFNAMNLSSGLLRNVRMAVAPVQDDQGRYVLTARTYRDLAHYQTRYGNERSREADVQLWQLFREELAPNAGQNRNPKLDQLVYRYQAVGLDGFERGESDDIFLPRLSAWHSPSSAGQTSKIIGALLLLLCLTWLCVDFGAANQDLGKVEWTMEWLFTMPVSGPALFLAQALGYAFSEPLMWVGAWPILIAIFVSAGWGWWSVLAGSAVALYLSVLIGSVRVSGETMLRSTLAPSRLKNLQALFTVFGMLGLFFLISNVTNSRISSGFLSWAMQMPDWPSWLPFSLPARLPAVGGMTSGALISMLGATALFPLGAVMFCGWLTRTGLVTVTGPYAASQRGPTAKRSAEALAPIESATAQRAGLIRGILLKDLRLLLRDRNFLVQTLVVPVMIIALQLVVNTGILEAVRSHFQQAAVLAFAVGAYVLIATALSVLSVEGNSVWMLYTFPQDIDHILRQKTKLWAAIALVYTIAILVACAVVNNTLQPSDAVFGVLAVAGVVIYAFIGAGIGILATDPLETEVRRRVRPEMVQLYMVLAAMYAHALYAPSAWTRLAQIVLSTLLAIALWQKVHDRAPFLLDPVAAAAPSISISDGMIAALAFFVLQGLFQISFVVARVPPGESLFLGFVIAGAIVVLLSLYIFKRTKVKGILYSVGLRRPPVQPGMSGSSALLLGIGGGAVAAAFASVYLKAIEWIPALRQLKTESLKLPFDPGIWLPVIAIAAAPVFEEFIFRGLVFRGLRRSTGLVTAIFGSAGIFAIVHPPISVLPVFVLGVIAAWTFERSKLLVSAIATHMIYNAAIVVLNSRS